MIIAQCFLTCLLKWARCVPHFFVLQPVARFTQNDKFIVRIHPRRVVGTISQVMHVQGLVCC